MNKLVQSKEERSVCCHNQFYLYLFLVIYVLYQVEFILYEILRYSHHSDNLLTLCNIIC